MNKDVTVKDQIKGLNRVSGDDVKIPSHWARQANTNPNKTFTEVLNNRRRGN